MDSSDIIKQYKQKTIFNNLIVTFTAKNPDGQCGDLKTNCCNDPTKCIRNFSSYDLKLNFDNGQKLIAGCSQ